jgi:hypothetical protein
VTQAQVVVSPPSRVIVNGEKFPLLQKAIIAGLTDSAAKLVLVKNLHVWRADGKPVTEDTPYNAHTQAVCVV